MRNVLARAVFYPDEWFVFEFQRKTSISMPFMTTHIGAMKIRIPTSFLNERIFHCKVLIATLVLRYAKQIELL